MLLTSFSVLIAVEPLVKRVTQGNTDTTTISVKQLCQLYCIPVLKGTSTRVGAGETTHMHMDLDNFIIMIRELNLSTSIQQLKLYNT